MSEEKKLAVCILNNKYLKFLLKLILNKNKIHKIMKYSLMKVKFYKKI
jgi:hypothetical protein